MAPTKYKLFHGSTDDVLVTEWRAETWDVMNSLDVVEIELRCVRVLFVELDVALVLLPFLWVAFFTEYVPLLSFLRPWKQEETSLHIGRSRKRGGGVGGLYYPLPPFLMADTDENKETNLPDCPDSFCLHSISHCNEHVEEENENKLLLLHEKISHRIIVTARIILLVFLCTWLFINKSHFRFFYTYMMRK